jgi:chemotaxis protein histidine kinase CheA
MVKQKPKRYSQRQHDKHQERAKNIMKKQKNGKTIVRVDERHVEEIASDFSQSIIEKARLNAMLKEANNLNEALLSENQYLREQLTGVERTIACLFSTIICLVAAGIFILF